MNSCPHVDAILYWVRAGQTTRAQIAAATESSARLPAKPIGLVATGLTVAPDEELGYESYAYTCTSHDH